jgi:hypothetical protein
MSRNIDGPVSPLFRPLWLAGRTSLDQLAGLGLSEKMLSASAKAPRGACVGWGIPFEVGEVVVVATQPVAVALEPTRARWLVFMHTSDLRPEELNSDGFISPMRGEGRLAEHAADYVVQYQDGSEARLPVLRRHQVGAFTRRWGENCFQAVSQHKPSPLRASHEQPHWSWGISQTRVDPTTDFADWLNWLWAWENPRPDQPICGLRFEPRSGALVVSAVSSGEADSQPLRWQTRRKAVLHLPPQATFRPELDENGLLEQVRLDLGQVISARLSLAYPQEDWSQSFNNQLPEQLEGQVLVEYTAHPQAQFHLWDGRRVAVAQVEGAEAGARVDGLEPVAAARRRVVLRVVEKGSRNPVAVKLHVHGEHGEYLAPVDRHRIVNPAWFEDYSVDFAHAWLHPCTYIPGETVLDLPLGRVYIEVSKGFEIRPLRIVMEIAADTDSIQIELERLLPWRARGWVTADTHVHFLSPMSAMLEGAAEGVNVVNLLASQWGELMTNVGDFDGATTWGTPETGGGVEDRRGEYLVRVGTENRQHVLGHISLLGYEGRIIAPMTTSGPDEAALGDPVDVLLTEWARLCRAQNGLVVLPHFPNPRAEHAAAIVDGAIDAIEMTSWGDLYSGISPYSLSDWYRYLNCGYLLPAVGGTDKMTADTAIGSVRTYAHLRPGELFTYENWKAAVRRAETFVSYGPLLDFAVAGQPMGSRLSLGSGGGTLDVTWQVASVTIPATRVDLVQNGVICASQPLPADGGGSQGCSGSWSVKVDKSSWLALLVRGAYPGKPEIVAAHSSPVLATVAGAPLLAAADAVTILEQIEGALAYLDTVGTRAEERTYKRMRLTLVSAHRQLHNRLHQQGYYHEHSLSEEHH